MTHARRFASVLSILVLLQAAWAGAAPGALAQEPAPTYTAVLPLVIGGTPDAPFPDLAYILETVEASRGNYYSAIEYRGLRLTPYGPIRVSRPEWSPDGTRIASRVAIMGPSGVNSDLYVLDPTLVGGGAIMEGGREWRCFTSWSPDGNLLPCGQVSDGTCTLSLAQQDGTVLRRLVIAGWPKRLRWSPDGQWIAYLMASGDEMADLRAVRTDGSGDVLLAEGVVDSPDPDERAYEWSPDGQWIAYVSHQSQDPSRQGELRLVSADGGHNIQVLPFVYMLDPPAWSPDGGSLAYHISPYATGVPESGVLVSAFVQAQLGLHLTLVGCDGDHPAWSPDGRHIAFGKDGIQVVHPDGSGRMRVASGLDWRWSPDGRRLAYVASVFDSWRWGGESSAVFVVWVDTMLPQPRKVVSPAFAPAWRPSP